MQPDNPYSPNVSDSTNPYLQPGGAAPYGPPVSADNPYAPQAQPGYGAPPPPPADRYRPPQPSMPYNPGYGPAPSPPPQPAVPFFLDPNGPYGPLRAPMPAPKRSRKGPVLVIGGIIGLTVIGILAAIIGGGGGGSSADDIFQGALQHALATTSYTQVTTYNQDDETFQYDLSSNSDPKMNSTVSLANPQLSFTGYGDLKNTYANFNKTDNLNVSDNLQNQWVQVRKAGKSPDSDDTLDKVGPLLDPQTQLLGMFIHGNFSESDRQSLLSLIQQQHIYTYSVDNASTSVVGGVAVYAYNVTINSDGLKQLNEKAAGIFGIGDDVVQAVESKGFPSAATFYVAINDQQVVKIEAKNGSDNITTTYSTFNGTQVSSEPVPGLQWSDLKQANNQGLDAKRKLQIGTVSTQLEVYRASKGAYPTLDNLNDPVWLKTNMPALDATQLRDPAAGNDTKLAAAPVQGQFAYQAATDKASMAACSAAAPCKYYKLTATLSDGTPYSKESL